MAKFPPRKSLRASPAVDPRGAPTANYGWTKPTIGGDLNAWGTQLNADLDGIDSTVHGVAINFSATAPAMDGTAATGSATTFAHSDHVHPTDTSRYAASNPSGYQTAAQVTASLGPYATTAALASYLPLAGGTLTGALVPSQTAGLTGTTTNNNANAGAVGEYVTAANLSGNALTTGVVNNIASISLTAGDWDVDGNVGFIMSVGATSYQIAISMTSATLPAYGSLGYGQLSTSTAQATFYAGPTGTVRVSIAATTTVYLVAAATFASGAGLSGGAIRARRVR